MRIALLAALATLLSGCPSCSGKHGTSAPPKPDAKLKEITIFLTTELEGTIEPCGCNSDPLGDLSRTAKLVADARAEKPAILFDGGSTLYTDLPQPPEKKPQEELKAALILKYLPELGLAASGLGPYDLAGGKANVKYPREAANLDATAGVPLEGPKVIDVGGVKVGVFGVVDPDALAPFDIKAAPPAEAATRAIAGLRQQGATIVVCLAHLKRKDAKKLARDAAGIDVMLVGEEAPDPDKPLTPVEQVGTTYLMQPHNRGQSIVRVELHVDTEAPGAPPLVDAIGPGRASARIADLDQEIADQTQRIAGFEKDPSADPAFVKAQKDDLAAKQKERQALVNQPLRAPKTGSWFTAELVPIKRALACDKAVQTAKQQLDATIGEANKQAFAGEQPAAVPKGGSGYAGVGECASCHQKQIDFWKQTKHAHAFATLAAKQKQWNRDCIGCHVTGWLEPGGATLAVNDQLQNVQCEVCHGPASRHVDADGKARETLVKTTPEKRCLGCHTPEHSDTFAYDAYLRDVTGPGHGEAFRKQLGDGPTGHELRAAALLKAGTGIGAGCEP